MVRLNRIFYVHRFSGISNVYCPSQAFKNKFTLFKETLMKVKFCLFLIHNIGYLGNLKRN